MKEYFTHRGYFDNKSIFENTCSAFKKSIEHGFGIELDVRLTKDEVLVVFHDKSLKRLFKQDMLISELTYEALKEYTFDGEKIPTFESVLNLVNGKVSLIVEIKNGSPVNLIASKVALMLDNYGGVFSIESFDPMIVRWFKKHRKNFKRGMLMMPARQYDSYILGIFMRSYITHFLAKPDFYAYERKLGSNKLSRFILSLFAKEIVVWTLKPGKACHFKRASAIIFENTLTPETLC